MYFLILDSEYDPNARTVDIVQSDPNIAVLDAVAVFDPGALIAIARPGLALVRPKNVPPLLVNLATGKAETSSIYLR
jgi:hypothetical protein